jgi:hypothetical protein
MVALGVKKGPFCLIAQQRRHAPEEKNVITAGKTPFCARVARAGLDLMSSLPSAFVKLISSFMPLNCGVVPVIQLSV